MKKANIKVISRNKRHKRIMKKISGTALRPRLCVSKTNKHLYAHFVDDVNNKTLLTISTLKIADRGNTKTNCCNIKNAELLGVATAKAAQDRGIATVVFDRGGYKYHGCVKSLAEAARKGGLQF